MWQKSYCLSIPRRKDFYEKTLKKLSKININCEVFYGFDGKDSNIREEYQNYINKFEYNDAFLDTEYAYALLKGHLKLFEHISNQNLQSVLIVEDDIKIHKNFNLLLNKQMPEFDVLYLGSSQAKWEDITIEKEGFYRCFNTYGAFAFIINKNFIEFLLKKIKIIIEEFPFAIDTMLVLFQKKYNFFCYHPNLIIADVSYSDLRSPMDPISHSIINKWNLNDYE
jgi:GR25 family glycosyltransferase involved in LPS biosynthesis